MSAEDVNTEIREVAIPKSEQMAIAVRSIAGSSRSAATYLSDARKIIEEQVVPLIGLAKEWQEKAATRHSEASETADELAALVGRLLTGSNHPSKAELDRQLPAVRTHLDETAMPISAGVEAVDAIGTAVSGLVIDLDLAATNLYGNGSVSEREAASATAVHQAFKGYTI
jgi:hypothetical protein